MVKNRESTETKQSTQVVTVDNLTPDNLTHFTPQSYEEEAIAQRMQDKGSRSVITGREPNLAQYDLGKFGLSHDVKTEEEVPTNPTENPGSDTEGPSEQQVPKAEHEDAQNRKPLSPFADTLRDFAGKLEERAKNRQHQEALRDNKKFDEEQAKSLQDEAFTTYEDNIAYSQARQERIENGAKSLRNERYIDEAKLFFRTLGRGALIATGATVAGLKEFGTKVETSKDKLSASPAKAKEKAKEVTSSSKERVKELKNRSLRLGVTATKAARNGFGRVKAGTIAGVDALKDDLRKSRSKKPRSQEDVDQAA